jgi:hypothetical protein
VRGIPRPKTCLGLTSLRLRSRKERRDECLIIALILFALAWSANAAVIFKDYKAPKDQYQVTLNKVYLDGLKDGLIASQAEMKFLGQRPEICLPNDLALTAEHAEEIVMREADKVTNPDSRLVAVLLLWGLEETFPCDNKN